MLQSNLVETFVNIAEAGSLNAAAGKLNLSRSVISERLSALEADLGTLLMTRSTRGLSLTSAGEIFLEHAREILATMESARDAVAEADGELTGRLRVAVGASLAHEWLMPIIADFLETHQSVTLEVSASDRKVDIIEDGFDVAIRAGQLADSDFLSRRLAPTRRTLICSPEYADKNGTPSSFAELNDHPAVVYGNLRFNTYFTFQTEKGVRSPRMHGRFETDSGALMREAAIAGVGITLLPNFLISRDLVAGRLVPIDIGYKPETNSLTALYPRAHGSMPRLIAFVDHMICALGDMPPWDKNLWDAGLLPED
jgi:DNA-binding transcriptional LysR family regulator